MQLSCSRLTLVAALFAAPVLAAAAPPAVPVVTVGADFKQLRFDFDPVPDASRYQLWFLPNGGAEWVKYMENLASQPQFRVSVSVHLLRWFNARYRVSACNASGCSSTASITVTEHMRDTVGYFKPRDTAVASVGFGSVVALSADGKTLAAVGGETIGPRANSAVVNVYRKGTSGWIREARLVPSPVEADTAVYIGGRTVSINGDGTVIAFGVPREFATFSGSANEGGAAYLFRRTGTTWGLERKFTLDGRRPYQYGKHVDIDDAGRTLAIWRRYEDDNPNNGAGAGTVEIFRNGTAGWTLATTLRLPSGTGACEGISLSGNSNILARSCGVLVQIFEGLNFTLRQTLNRGSTAEGRIEANYDGSLIVTNSANTTPAPEGATWTPRVTVYRRGSTGWSADPAFTHVGNASNPPTGSFSYGLSLAISADGRFVAVGDPNNRNGGTGVVRGPLTVTPEYSGAFFIYERNGSAWALRNMIKANVLGANYWFGNSLAFGDNGGLLAVGSPYEASGARGIDGDQTDMSSPRSGAVWLY